MSATEGQPLTVPQAAARISQWIGAEVPARTVYELVRRAEIGHLRIGGRIWVPESDLTAYLTRTYVPAKPGERVA